MPFHYSYKLGLDRGKMQLCLQNSTGANSLKILPFSLSTQTNSRHLDLIGVCLLV